MMITFGKAKTTLAKFVDGGSTTSDVDVSARINEACEILATEGDWKGLVRRIRVNKTNNIFCLPESVETVMKMNRCRQPSFVWTQAYEFVMGGVGSVIEGSEIATSDLIHLGDGFPTFFPVTTEVAGTAKKIAAFSKSVDDVGKTIRIRGYDSTKSVINPTTPGEVINVQRWDDGVEGAINGNTLALSTNSFLEISSIVKAETNDYVTLYAVTEADNEYWFLGKYSPYETNPGYSWYKLGGSECDDEEHLIMLVKVKHVDMVHDSDILTIQYLHAVKLQLKAMYEFDYGDTATGLMLQNAAILFLNKQLMNANRGQGQMDIDTFDSMGAVDTVI